jgi:hypothetical protein
MGNDGGILFVTIFTKYISIMKTILNHQKGVTMFNPFSPFDPRLLGAFRRQGVRVFVKQTLQLCEEEDDQDQAFLLTHFTDPSRALEHYSAIKEDPNRQVFSLDHPESWQKLASMINRPPAGQRFFTALTIKNVNQKAKMILDRKVRAYIRNETNWRPARHEKVNFSLDFNFGEIYVVLGYYPEQLKVRLTELERQPSYVL